MAEQYSATIRTAMGQVLADALADGSLKLFSGALPANVTTAFLAVILAGLGWAWTQKQ